MVGNDRGPSCNEAARVTVVATPRQGGAACADMAQVVTYEDFLGDYPNQCRRRLSVSTEGGRNVVQAATRGDEHARAFLDDLTLVDVVVRVLTVELAVLKARRKAEPWRSARIADALAAAWGAADALCHPMARVLQDRRSPAPQVEGLRTPKNRPDAVPASQEMFDRQAQLVVGDFLRLAVELRNMRDGHGADADGGRHLFSLLVEHVTVPGIAKRKDCMPDEVIGRYIDQDWMEVCLQSCREIGSDFTQDALAFMTLRLRQAFRLYQSGSTAEGGSFYISAKWEEK
ncbi:hypothetical protein MyNCGM683_06600 [Achromobacter xylosoxidans]